MCAKVKPVSYPCAHRNGPPHLCQGDASWQAGGSIYTSLSSTHTPVSIICHLLMPHDVFVAALHRGDDPCIPCVGDVCQLSYALELSWPPHNRPPAVQILPAMYLPPSVIFSASNLGVTSETDESNILEHIRGRGGRSAVEAGLGIDLSLSFFFSCRGGSSQA
jgi:hypothetical protein